MMAQPVQAADIFATYPDSEGDLTRHTTYTTGGGWIYDWTPLGGALANVDIIESSLTLTEIDDTETYIFEMTTAGDLPTENEPQEIDLSSVVLLFWFWTIEFGYSDDYSFWNGYDVMLIWDCAARSYSTVVWDYRPCIETNYQPDREQVGVPAFEVDGPSAKVFMPVSWLPEDNWYDFCWMYVTAVRWGEYALEITNSNGGFTGGRDYWVDWTDLEVAAEYPDPIPISTKPWLLWSLA
jgi:hypothetical protein